MVTTFTETVAGETETEIPVTGSMQAELEVAVDVLDVVVVQVIAVLAAGVPPQEVSPRADAPRKRI